MNSGPSWARHYVTHHHRRLCARPGCGAHAAATLRFQPTQREAWLVDLDTTGARTEGDLCARHAAGLVLPRGWELHDERTKTVEEPAPPRRSKSIAKARQRRVKRPEPPAEEPAPPQLSADIFDVQTPLLRRAFENVKPLDE
jgi:hypothetical protein